MTAECYQIKVFGLSQGYVGGTDVKAITSRVYDEDTAWNKARTLLREIEESETGGQVFVTKCTAEVTPEYDVPVMDPHGNPDDSSHGNTHENGSREDNPNDRQRRPPAARRPVGDGAGTHK